MANKVDRRLVEILETPVDVKKLVDRLFFSADNIEKAALSQPTLQFEVGKLRTQLYMRKSSLRRKLARATGKKGLKIRKREDIKTEGAVKGVLAQDPAIQSLQRKFDRIEAYDLAVEDLREAYKERNMAIGFLVKLRTAEMMSELRSIRGEEMTDKMRKRAEKVRHKFEELDDAI